MGRAGKALRQVLETYSISQNQLAEMLEVKPYVVYRWFHEQTDPAAEKVVDITKALKKINQNAAEDFARLYLINAIEEES